MSILLSVVGFATSVMLIPELLNVNPPVNRPVYVVNDSLAIKYVDTLIFSNKPLKFRLQEVSQTTGRQLETRHGQLALYTEFYFNHNPKLLLWIGFMAVGIAFALAMLPHLLHYFLQMKNNKKWLALLASFLSISVVFYFAHYSTSNLSLLPPRIMTLGRLLFYSNDWILQLLVSIYLIPSLFALAGNFMITNVLTRYYVSKKRASLKKLLKLKRHSFWLLTASSVMLVMGIVTSSLLRESILTAAGPAHDYLFPFEFVLAYSLSFTFFLLIFYGPANVLLGELIAKKKEEATSEGQKPSAAFSVRESFELSLSILAPVISGLLIEWLT
ncbi:hypothetical protein FNH22_13910 [Fulvivirga sp. M361]|uniref:hypothetical protein n=1 Tax=Fulvivirga sp. M361 TaxID=2594266 RepID=UPI00117B2E67|nr:hypothetical protein [Fulvivirga sp. M361]TRX58436.1 hypothetical protein FNH22_13910 [Fulvivirga sp. M361]